jgi:histidinol phosphatase-like enzyme
MQVLIITKDGTINSTPHDLMVMKRDSLSLIKEEDSWFTAWDGDKYDLLPEYCQYLL